MRVISKIPVVLSIILSGFGFLACSTEVIYQPVSQKMVVEGWIENGEAPVVIVSQLLPIGVVVDSFDLWNVPIRFARVAVSDGENEYVLTGRPDGRYLTGYAYSTNELRGEVGKEYVLTVSYEGKVLTARTSILPPVQLQNVRISPISPGDTLCQISATILDSKPIKNYYLIRVRQGSAEAFCPSMGGVFEDALLTTPETRIPIYKPVKIGNMKSIKNKTPFFTTYEPVEVRLCNIQQSPFYFWAEFMNVAINASNPIYPSVDNLPGNITGGLGIWYGAGISTVYLNISDSIRIQNAN